VQVEIVVVLMQKLPGTPQSNCAYVEYDNRLRKTIDKNLFILEVGLVLDVSKQQMVASKCRNKNAMRI
jgi:hypothetical protein